MIDFLELRDSCSETKNCLILANQIRLHYCLKPFPKELLITAQSTYERCIDSVSNSLEILEKYTTRINLSDLQNFDLILLNIHGTTAISTYLESKTLCLGSKGLQILDCRRMSNIMMLRAARYY